MTLAKTTRPRLAHVVARPRLFRRLDCDRGRRVSWVWGPPGAGKSALVASYLVARNLRHIWYRVDQGDADLGSLF